MVAGAGGEKMVGPDPHIVNGWLLLAQVPTVKAHLRQKPEGPAPGSPSTCANVPVLREVEAPVGARTHARRSIDGR